MIVVDATTLMTRRYRPLGRGAAPDPDRPDSGLPRSQRHGSVTFKSGDDPVRTRRRPRPREVVPCLIGGPGRQGRREDWQAFFREPRWAHRGVVADLDRAVGRAVRETWPGATSLPLAPPFGAAPPRRRRAPTGSPSAIRLDTPLRPRRPYLVARRAARSGGTAITRCYAAIDGAQVGPPTGRPSRRPSRRHVRPTASHCAPGSPRRDAHRAPVASRAPLSGHHGTFLPRSTGALEGRMGEWLAPLRRRAGRWQNVRRSTSRSP